MKVFSAGILAAITGNHEYAHLVTLDLVGGIFRVTDNAWDLDLTGGNFLGNGLLLDIDNIKTKSDITVGTFKITLAGDPSLVSLLLGASQVNRTVTIQRIYLDDEGEIIDEPLTIWTGLITEFNHKTSDKVNAIELSIASEWADFKKTIGRRTTSSSQHKFFPNDRGLEFAAEAGKEYKWGR